MLRKEKEECMDTYVKSWCKKIKETISSFTVVDIIIWE